MSRYFEYFEYISTFNTIWTTRVVDNSSKHGEVALCFIQYGEKNPQLCRTMVGNNRKIMQHTSLVDSDPMVDNQTHNTENRKILYLGFCKPSSSRIYSRVSSN